LIAAIFSLLSSTALAHPPSPPAATVPSPIRLNQLGFEMQGRKRAVFPNPSDTPLPWRLIDHFGAVAATGETRVFGEDRASGEHLHLVDLGGFNRPGNGYVLTVGSARSRTFSISAHPYRQLKAGPSPSCRAPAGQGDLLW
jgi:endoglucanase